jgi:hypothetical protein
LHCLEDDASFFLIDKVDELPQRMETNMKVSTEYPRLSCPGAPLEKLAST